MTKVNGNQFKFGPQNNFNNFNNFVQPYYASSSFIPIVFLPFTLNSHNLPQLSSNFRPVGPSPSVNKTREKSSSQTDLINKPIINTQSKCFVSVAVSINEYSITAMIYLPQPLAENNNKHINQLFSSEHGTILHICQQCPAGIYCTTSHPFYTTNDNDGDNCTDQNDQNDQNNNSDKNNQNNKLIPILAPEQTYPPTSSAPIQLWSIQLDSITEISVEFDQNNPIGTAMLVLGVCFANNNNPQNNNHFNYLNNRYGIPLPSPAMATYLQNVILSVKRKFGSVKNIKPENKSKI
jgi:hypothetical protein